MPPADLEAQHAHHCCPACGCKYGDDDCPVVLGIVAAARPHPKMYSCHAAGADQEDRRMSPREDEGGRALKLVPITLREANAFVEQHHRHHPPARCCRFCCDGPHQFDTSVPSVAWNAVIRAKGISEFLCTRSIVREFVLAGRSFTAQLWGGEDCPGVTRHKIEVLVDGQASTDATAISDENTEIRWKLSEAERERDKLRATPHAHDIDSCNECLDLENLGATVAADKLREIAEAGEHHGVFGGENLEAAAKAIMGVWEARRQAEEERDTLKDYQVHGQMLLNVATLARQVAEAQLAQANAEISRLRSEKEEEMNLTAMVAQGITHDPQCGLGYQCCRCRMETANARVESYRLALIAEHAHPCPRGAECDFRELAVRPETEPHKCIGGCGQHWSECACSRPEARTSDPEEEPSQ